MRSNRAPEDPAYEDFKRATAACVRAMSGETELEVTYGAEAAAVSAVRQASIPVSILLAAIILLEPSFLKNIAWASLIMLGILLITLSTF